MTTEQLLQRVGNYDSVEQLHERGTLWVEQLLKDGELVSSRGLILDYGAGLGRLSIPLSHRGFSVCAVDECRHMRSYLTSNGVIAYPPSYLDNDDAFRETFDVAFCCYVLQHNSPAVVRGILQRIGNCADRLLFTVPFRESQDIPTGFVRPSEVDDKPVGAKEKVSACYDPISLRLLFHESSWNVATLSRLNVGGGLWSIHRIKT